MVEVYRAPDPRLKHGAARKVVPDQEKGFRITQLKRDIARREDEEEYLWFRPRPLLRDGRRLET